MAQNIGTLISSSIRPNDSLDPIASAFASEIKGGLHTTSTSSDRDLIISQRREWGMMCYVINEDKIYQLKYGYIDTNINNNTNWVEFTGGSGGGSNEWLDSVLSRTNTPPMSPSNGDRYLIDIPASGLWSSHDNKVTQWNNITSLWEFTVPSDGTTLRVDDQDNSIYKYEGVYPSGIWNKELLNQVRFISVTSSNGLQYNSVSTPLFNSYISDIIYLATFATANSGSASLSINSVGDVTIKKLSGLGFVDLDPNDISVGIVYTVTYDGSNFQVNIPVGATSVGVIGPAEDGDYSDGLFTDFTSTTPIGTPIDRFNEILKSLVPPPAPSLTDWTGSKAGVSTSGKLSFDSTQSIATYVGADTAPVTPISVDGTWTINGIKRLGIASSNSGDLSGILNDQVVAHTGTPNPAYVANSFGDANLGLLRLYINGFEKVSAQINLTNTVAQNTTSGNTISGFILSAATASKFPGGDTFESWSSRTGTWLVKSSDFLLTNGYNYIHVVHDNSLAPLGPFTRTLTRFEFIVDADTTATVISGATISSYLLTGSKLLSGVNYYTGGSIRYDVAVDNLYRNTYYHLSDAVSVSDSSTGNTIPFLSTANLSLANSLGNEAKQFKISNSDQNGSSLTFSILTPGKRRINESIILGSSAKRTVASGSRLLTTSGGSVTLSNIVLDNVSSTSTALFEGFDDEVYRLKNTGGGFQYDIVSNITSNPWGSGQSLIGVTAGWNDGLQVVGGRLVYPTQNFASFGNSGVNLNFSNLLTSYNLSVGNRMYTRYFRQTSPTTSKFTLLINGSGGNFVSKATSLTANNIHVEIKLPTQTGWLDAYVDFNPVLPNPWIDGAGCRNATAGVGRNFGVNWGLDVVIKSTFDSSGYVVIRITTGPSFTGHFESINLQFS